MKIAFVLPSLANKGPNVFTKYLIEGLENKVDYIEVFYFKNPVLKVLFYSNLFLYIKVNIFIASKYIIFLLIAYYTIVLFDKILKIFYQKINVQR